VSQVNPPGLDLAAIPGPAHSTDFNEANRKALPENEG
jgi:hypothetical protein